MVEGLWGHFLEGPAVKPRSPAGCFTAGPAEWRWVTQPGGAGTQGHLQTFPTSTGGLTESPKGADSVKSVTVVTGGVQTVV